MRCLTECLLLPEMTLISASTGRVVADRKTCLFHNSKDNQRLENLIEPGENTNERNEFSYAVGLEKTVPEQKRDSFMTPD